MKLLVIGSGGREHAVIRKLAANERVEKIYALPGNGGIARDAECVDIAATDIEAIAEFAQSRNIDFAAVIPDDPLVLGLVDVLENAGIPCFGPSKAAAVIEGSKAFAKELMHKYKIPTAAYEVFTDYAAASEYLSEARYPLVIKADGLALGKGVIICKNGDEAQAAVESMMLGKRFGKGGEKIVIEEYLEGVEVSVLAFTDGEHVLPLVSAMDHKRIGEGDTGLNTGGMGAIAPNPYYTESVAQVCLERIFLPTIHAMAAEGRTFKGCLYFGLMLTADGPKVIEYNARFGDPEAQAVLPLLQNDLLDLMLKIRFASLADVKLEFADAYAACVCMANKGYPLSYEKDVPLAVPEDMMERVYIAGCKQVPELPTASAAAIEDASANAYARFAAVGGRVLAVTNVAGNLNEALAATYKDLARIDFKAAYYRKDIGQKALACLKWGNLE